MTIKPIKTKADYETAMKRLERIFDAKAGTSQGDELEVLSLLVEHYENKHHRIPKPDPIEAIKFRMDQLGMTPSGLANVLGHKSRVSEILNRKRKLTLQMVRVLSSKLSIPTDVLVQDYQTTV